MSPMAHVKTQDGRRGHPQGLLPPPLLKQAPLCPDITILRAAFRRPTRTRGRGALSAVPAHCSDQLPSYLVAPPSLPTCRRHSSVMTLFTDDGRKEGWASRSLSIAHVHAMPLYLYQE